MVHGDQARKGCRSRSWPFPLAFLLLVFVSARLGRLPAPVPYAYLALSLVTFVLYLKDKRAAMDNRRRISERTLHLAALCGGWPGGWIAQGLLHHKTRKRSFLLVFMAAALANCGLLALLGLSFF